LETTSQRIAEQSRVAPNTVERVEKLVETVDRVDDNTGINPLFGLMGA